MIANAAARYGESCTGGGHSRLQAEIALVFRMPNVEKFGSPSARLRSAPGLQHPLQGVAAGRVPTAASEQAQSLR